MQATLRAEGRDSMNPAQYASFVDAFNQGELLKPEQPGNVIAAFVVEPSKELSGQFLPYVSYHAERHCVLTRRQLELAGAGFVPTVMMDVVDLCIGVVSKLPISK